MNCLSQSSQFIITLFQLILVVALRHNSTSSLEPEFAITADKGTNYNSLIQIAVQSYESDTSTISATASWGVQRPCWARCSASVLPGTYSNTM